MKANREGAIATRPGTGRLARIVIVTATLALTALGVVPPAAAAAPSNDKRTGAVDIGSLPFTYTEDTRHATSDGPRRCGDERSVFFRFTPDTAVDVQIDTVGSSYDTILAVFTRTADGRKLIACSDDAINSWGTVRFGARAGRAYLIMVTTWWRGGDLRLNATEVTDEPFDGSVTVEGGTVDPDTGIATIVGTATCNQPSAVSIGGELRQLRSEIFVARGWSSEDGYCLPGSTTDWSFEVDSETAVVFAAGDARLRWGFIQLRAYKGRLNLTPVDPTPITLT